MAGSGSTMANLPICMIPGVIIIQVLKNINCFFKVHQSIFQIFFIVDMKTSTEVFFLPRIHGGMT